MQTVIPELKYQQQQKKVYVNKVKNSFLLSRCLMVTNTRTYDLVNVKQ